MSGVLSDGTPEASRPCWHVGFLNRPAAISDNKFLDLRLGLRFKRYDFRSLESPNRTPPWPGSSLRMAALESPVPTLLSAFPNRCLVS